MLLLEIGPRQGDGRRRQIDAGDVGAAPGEARQVDAGPAADFEHLAPAPAVEVHEPQQMVQLFEVILVEIVEEAARANGMLRDLEIVDVLFPVVAHFVHGRHGRNYS